MGKRKHVSVQMKGDVMAVHFDPLFAVKSVRRTTGFNTATKAFKPKKGKGSYDRQAMKRAERQGPFNFLIYPAVFLVESG